MRWPAVWHRGDRARQRDAHDARTDGRVGDPRGPCARPPRRRVAGRYAAHGARSGCRSADRAHALARGLRTPAVGQPRRGRDRDTRWLGGARPGWAGAARCGPRSRPLRRRGLGARVDHRGGVAMTARSRVAAVAGAVVLTVAGAVPVRAHDPSPIFEGDGLWAQDADLTFDWSDAWMAPFAMRVAIKDGAADANASRGSRAATFRALDGARNVVTYGTEVVCGTGGLACMRRNAPTGFGLWFRENGHRFDWGTLRWCQLYDAFPNGCYDVENITLDELGHVEILDHHV